MNKFKTDSNIRYTKALFYETSYTDTSCILYTLKDQNWETTDGRPLKSFYLLFMEYCENDPSEFTFAKECLDGWDHWLMIRDAVWFKPYYAKWKEELFIRVKSKALVNIIKESRTFSKNSFSINRYLLEKGWEPQGGTKHSKGRPSTSDIKKAAVEALEAQETLSKDMQLIKTLN